MATILKETYRFIFSIRNEIIHNREGKIENNILKIKKNSKNGKTLEIRVKYHAVFIFYDIIYLLLNYKMDSSHSNITILESMYKEACEGLKTFNDRIYLKSGTKISEIPLKQNLSWKKRYYQEETSLEELQNAIKIKNAFKNPKPEIEIFNKEVDYNIFFKGNRYIIPSQCLDKNFSISSQEMKEWEIKNENCISPLLVS